MSSETPGILSGNRQISQFTTWVSQYSSTIKSMSCWCGSKHQNAQRELHLAAFGPAISGGSRVCGGADMLHRPCAFGLNRSTGSRAKSQEPTQRCIRAKDGTRWLCWDWVSLACTWFLHQARLSRWERSLAVSDLKNVSRITVKTVPTRLGWPGDVLVCESNF